MGQWADDSPRLRTDHRRRALVAVACGGSDAETSSSSTSTTSPDSGSSTTSGNAAEPTTSSDPTFVIADFCHDGSSDATFDDSGGVYATLLTAIDPAGRTATSLPTPTG